MKPNRILYFLSILICLAFNAAGTDSGLAADQSQSETFIARVASFKNPVNFEKYLKFLESKGLKTWSNKVIVPGKGQFYRVYITSFDSHESAVKAMQELKRMRVISDFAIEMKNSAPQGNSRVFPKTAGTKKLPAESESGPKAITVMSPQSPGTASYMQMHKSQKAKATEANVQPEEKASKPAPTLAGGISVGLVKNGFASNLVIFVLINVVIIDLLIILLAKSLKLYAGRRSESQQVGVLDVAFDRFHKCNVDDQSGKELPFNLGHDFERTRIFNKTVEVYEHINRTGGFNHIEERTWRKKSAGDTMIFGLTGDRNDSTVMLEGAKIGPTLRRYEIIQELGHGAMGTVYLGRDPRINREVAIKTLRYEEIDEGQLGEIKKRFFQEAEAAGKLSHPNIVTIYDVGEDYELAYMAMELLDGADLTKYCNKDGRLPISEIIRIVSLVANTLDYAHKNGVVHRDIKPSNIMVLKNGEIRVTDFGIAHVMSTSRTQIGVVLGTPSYMSPEQITGQKIDGRSDLFSLGVVFYELLTGEKPFQGESITTLMYKITTTPPVPLRDLAPHVPEPFVDIVAKVMAKDPKERYQTGSEFANDLTACIKI